MTVVTLARQVGSGGQVVATALSRRLGLRIVDRKELRNEASKRGLSLPESFVKFASEEAGSGLNHYLSYGELEFDQALRGGTSESRHDTGFLSELSAQSREILLTLQVVIYDLASQENVLFVGAGAQILLANIPQVLRVKIIAPVETRIDRMVSAYSLSPDEARAAVEAGDQEQVEYNRVIFGEDWHNPELWDLVVNSDVLSVDQIVDLFDPLTKSTPSIADLRQHLSHASEINRAMLDLSSAGNVDAYAMPATDGILLRGEVPNDDIRGQLMEIAISVSPGTNVINGLAVQALR